MKYKTDFMFTGKQCFGILKKKKCNLHLNPLPNNIIISVINKIYIVHFNTKMPLPLYYAVLL